MLSMKCAFGVRFSLNDTTEEQIWSELFALFCADELCGMRIHGGVQSEMNLFGDTYLCVIEADSIKRIRKVHQKLKEDAFVNRHIALLQPYLEKNQLAAVQGLACFGMVGEDGRLCEGESPLFGLSCAQKAAVRPQKENMRILLAPDSFKGTFTSAQAIARLAAAARRHFVGAQIIPLPIADGGEGTLDALVAACGGQIVLAEVHDPLQKPIQARYGVLYGKTVIIEMAEASGLTLLNEEQRNPLHTTTFGTGELIVHALNAGYRSFIVALGGSATNDGGLGCLSALGARATDQQGNVLVGTGADLQNVAELDLTQMHPAIAESDFTLMCDVKNPLLGENGATMVYGPQKGGTPEQLQLLEQGMRRYADLLMQATNKQELIDLPGAGAAGGLGAALYACCNAQYRSGIDLMLDVSGFDEKIRDVSLVVTGEGSLDRQSVLYGKAVMGVLRRSQKQGVPVAVLAGSIEPGALANEPGCSGMAAVSMPVALTEAMEHAQTFFDDAADRLFGLIRIGMELKNDKKGMKNA